MTVTTHHYAATLPGDAEVSITDGVLSIDTARAPHVEADLTVAMPGAWVTESITNPLTGLPMDVPRWAPDTAALDALDPRTSPAPRVTLTTGVEGGTPREWDLHVRDRDIDYRDASVRIRLASDEALLEDYAPLADDDTPFDLASSLRDVVNYVLGEAIPGAALEATPAIDADVTPRWEQTNLILNPSGQNGTTGWVTSTSGGVAGSLSTGTVGGSTISDTEGSNPPAYVRLSVTTTGTGNALCRYGSLNERRITPGRLYTFSAWVHQSSPSAKNGLLSVRFMTEEGATTAVFDATKTVPASTWTKLTITALAPVNSATVYVYAGVTNGMPSGSFVGVTGAVLAEGVRNDRWFDGNRADEAAYTYDWTPDAYTTPSVRVPVGDAIDPEALTWKAGQTALEFLMPLLQSRGLRLVCDEQRRWTLRDETFTASGSLNLREGVNLVEADDTISRDSGIWFDARVTKYTWTDRYGNQQERTDSYALNDPYTRLETLEISAAYPGPGRSEYAVRRAQGVGREVTTASVSRWSATAEQSVSVTLPNAPAQVGTVRAVQFDFSTDEMTVTTRTRELPDGAVDLLQGTVDALVGTVNDL